MVAESLAINKHRGYYLNLGLTLKPRTPVDDSSIEYQAALIDSVDEEQIKGALESDKKTFVAKLPSDITHDVFFIKLGEQSDGQEQKVLGDDYVEEMASAVLYPSVMAPYPATFDTSAIAGIIDMIGVSNYSVLFNPETDLQTANKIVDRTGYITNRMLQLGSIEHLYEDRFIIPPHKKEKLSKILENIGDEE